MQCLLQKSRFCTIYNTTTINSVNAKKTNILSVHSRRPYFLSNFLECRMDPAVFCSSSLVPSTLADEDTSVSKVAALFCVVSDKWRDIDSIRSVMLSCWYAKPDCVCLDWPPRWRTSVVLANSSALLSFSISNIVVMLARRNACKVLQKKRIR